MSTPARPVIVVGVDGSDMSMKAVRWADRHATDTGGSLHLVAAWERPVMYGDTAGVGVGFDPAKDASYALEKSRQEVTVPPERLETSVVAGSPRTVLTKFAQDADVLVVGAKGHSAIAALMLGSVSAYCVHHSTIPVVVVR